LSAFVGRPGAVPTAAVGKKDGREPRNEPAREELKICGLAAVKARFERDPGSILRLFFDEPTSRKVGVMSKALALAKKIYRCVPPAELEKISGSIHHGGIVAVVAAPTLRIPNLDHVRAWAKARDTVLVLDRIGNAHNLGAIARTAAFFGVLRIVSADDATASRPTEAAHRVAEGGLEHVDLWLRGDRCGDARRPAGGGVGVGQAGGAGDGK